VPTQCPFAQSSKSGVPPLLLGRAQDREKGKKRTGLESQEHHETVIFHLFGDMPPLYRLEPKLKINKIFRVTVLQMGEFSIFLLTFAWSLQQCLPVICDFNHHVMTDEVLVPMFGHYKDV